MRSILEKDNHGTEYATNQTIKWDTYIGHEWANVSRGPTPGQAN